MKKVIVILSLVLMTGMGFSQGTGLCDGSGSGNINGNGGQGSQSGMNGENGSGSGVSYYDINTEVTVSGTVLSFYSVNEDALNPTNPVILLEDGSELIVQTGPAWFMDNQEFSIDIDDSITVTGSLITGENGNSLILAREIISGDMSLVLRDELGSPLWKGTRDRSSGSERNPNSYMNVSYDITLETTVYASVDAVMVATYTPGTYPGYQMTVILEDGTLQNVMLAPFWYLDSQDFSIEAGTEIVMTGVYLTLEDGSTIFVVRLLSYDDSELILRDDAGIPLWQALRGRNRN